MNAIISSLSLAPVASRMAQGGDDYPVRPAGTPAAGAGSPPVGSSRAIGRVCVIDDPRELSACAPDAEGLTVTLDGAAATTAADGSFTMSAPAAADPVVSVTGPGMVPTQMAFSPAMSIPVLRADLFAQMMQANGIPVTSGSASILGA